MLKCLKFVFVVVVVFAVTAKALDISPRDALVRGRADDAIRDLTRQASVSNPSTDTLHDLCRAYYMVGDWDNAIRYGEQAVRKNASNSEYQLWLGRAYGEKANSIGPLSAFSFARKTVAALEKAVKLNPANIRARRDLAEYYATAPGVVGGGKDKARKLADEIAASDPVNASWIRGLVAEHEKNSTEAENQYKTSVAASGDAAKPLIELAHFYRGEKRWSDFDTTIERVLSSSKRSDEDVFNASELMIQANRKVPVAIQTLQKYLNGPMDEYGPAFRVHYLLGQAFEQLGQRDNAIREYKTAVSLASTFRPAQNALQKLGS